MTLDKREACSECNGLGFGPFGGCGECRGSGQASWQRTQSAGAPDGWRLVMAIELTEEKHGSLRAAARALGIDAGYLSRLKKGEKVNPSEEVLAALGLERMTMYRASQQCTQSSWVPEAKVTGEWESARIGDFNAGWNACRDSVFTLMKKAAYMELDTTKRSIAIQDELRAQLAAAPAQPAAQEDYPECDYCGVTPDHHPWHGSGLLGGVESRHIHACNSCRHLLPASPAQSEKVAHSAQWPTTPGLAAATAQHQRYGQGEVQRLREALHRIRDHAARIMDDEVFYEADSALSASTGQEVKP